ncbi:hypothetical protein [Aquimarina muelleri]|uniref:Uncharacterized protein n=1 Tax=Aquimarina muelleri TaxID=279356 RepID=A0A918JY10_9FLAO|nr:hypothetical protein [Aquimarina muelleri]MCX2763697.1 hypothetical protein [Aquimarina muelleri]GGX30406.1 hypothetical protein GCM10007384_34420 [Aquimarina muelleri]
MKKGVLSIGIACIGFYFLYTSNMDLYHRFLDGLAQSQNVSEFTPTIFAFGKTLKIITLCMGLLSLYFGIISFLKKNKIAIIGILLAILLMVCSFIPFWKYMLKNSGLDISF